jgi:sugar phosphate permease
MPHPTATARSVARLRWTGFAIVVAAYVLSFFHRTAPAAIASELSEAFHTSGVTLGLLAATYFYVYTVMQLPTGVLVDALGTRRIVALGGVLAGVGSIAFGSAHTVGLAAAGRLLVGLGVSVVFVALVKLVAEWFREREFATVIGASIFLGNVGSVLSGAPLAWGVTVVSWRAVFIAVGVVSIALGVLAWRYVHDRPQDLGLPSLHELPAAGQRSAAPWYVGLLEVLRNPHSWPGFFVNLGVAGSFLTFAGLWGVPYLTQAHGMSRTAASVHTSTLLLGFAIGSVAVGILSDRLGRRKPVLVVLCGLYCASWLPWLAGVSMPAEASVALFLATGMAAAGFTLTWASAKELNRPASAGMATSLVNTGVFLGVAVLQPVVGWILDRSTGGAGAPVAGAAEWRMALGALAAAALAGLACAALLKETYCRNVNPGAAAV